MTPGFDFVFHGLLVPLLVQVALSSFKGAMSCCAGSSRECRALRVALRAETYTISVLFRRGSADLLGQLHILGWQ